MQPYIFPYLGYYQLVKAVDTFVFFNDVNFIKKGWINRNNILVQNQAYRFTISLNNASQNRMINEIEILDYARWKTDFLKILSQNYKKAPHFAFFYSWLENFLSAKEYHLIGDLASDSIRSIAALLDLKVEFISSSEINYQKDNGLEGQDKILDICKILRANTYINPRNGESLGLYDKERFRSRELDLYFINMHDITYDQFQKDNFVPYLSILDVLMFNSREATAGLLDRYSL